ncbi:26S proteasome regulatory subunit 7 homolog A-like [Lactuca sativa]|nr:26S proteasome regulatory subunit 7 homolog A-like [Lactuca sativa]
MPTDIEDEIRDEKNPPPLDEDDIALLKTYGLGPYSTSIKKNEKDVKEMAKRINDLCGKLIFVRFLTQISLYEDSAFFACFTT